MKGIADTGFLVAFLARRDRYHDWAVRVARKVEPPLLTCEAVLAETAHQVKSVKAVMELLGTGMVRTVHGLEAWRERIGLLAERYAERNPDLADLCLICLSEENPKLPVVTVDGDFRVFRRNRRERIPVMMPEAGDGIR